MIDDPLVDRSHEFAMLQALREQIRTGVRAAAEDKIKADGAMATDREYVDLKLEATEARTEARFAELNSKLDRIIDSFSAANNNIQTARLETQSLRDEVRQDYRSTRSTIIITGLTTALALAALLISIVTYGDAIFGRGMSVRDVVSSVVKEQSDRAAQGKTSAP